MASPPILPASLAFDADVTPYSPDYGDVYHSADSGPGQARHVFLAGNDLPQRWAQARIFTIVETGFGLGLNFLTTWAAWRADPLRCARLHYVTIEKHPFTRESLTTLHARYPEFTELSAQLQAAWPPLVPGWHRLHFDNGCITLTLVLGDIAETLPQLQLSADAIYLDGFSPERNPAMWTPQVMKALSRLAHDSTTLATYTAARTVRNALTAAGFAIEKRPGFGRKRDMLAGQFAPQRVGQLKRTPATVMRSHWPERRALVIGAGLAGAAVCERLSTRGWHIELIDRCATPAAEASGLYAGAFHPHVSPDDCGLSRLTRAGFLYALARWRALAAEGHVVSWGSCGVLQLAANDVEAAQMAATLSSLGTPADYAEYLPRDAASVRVNCEVAAGGWWFPAGGWLRAHELVTAQLATTTHLKTHFNCEVQTLSHDGTCWHAHDKTGIPIASAPVVVLANAHDATRLAAVGITLQRVRGQISLLPTAHNPALAHLRAVVCGNGYVLPAVNDLIVAGSTYDGDADSNRPQPRSDADNLAQLRQLLPQIVLAENPMLRGEVGFRCIAPDRMPLIGALPDLTAIAAQAQTLCGAQLADLPRLPGLYGAFAYGSRGLTWAALGAECIASQIEGAPSPLAADLKAMVDPARFVLKQVRRGTLQP